MPSREGPFKEKVLLNLVLSPFEFINITVVLIPPETNMFSMYTPIFITDLRIPPANRLKQLKGDLIGLYSIRINNQWRITFSWTNNNTNNVKIEDYHG